MVTPQNDYLHTPPSSQSVFLFVRPRDSTKSHYRPYSTLDTSLARSSVREPSLSSSERPMSMMGFKKSSKLKANDEKTFSSNASKSGGMSLFGKTIKKKRSYNGLRLLNNATDVPSPLGSPSLIVPHSPDPYSSDSSATLLNSSSNDASSSSSKTPSEEQLVSFPRTVPNDDEGAIDNSDSQGSGSQLGWVERRKMKLHRCGDAVPYMLSYDNVLLNNDKSFNTLLRRLNPWNAPTFSDYTQSGTTLPSSALDLGCGPGYWMLDAASHWKQAQIVGLDCVNILLPEVRACENINFIRTNFILSPFPFPANTFDFVRLSNLSTSIPCDRWEFVLSEVFRVLRYDGRLELIDDQRFFPSFKVSASKTVKYHEEKAPVPSVIFDGDQLAREPKPDLSDHLVKEETKFPTQNEINNKTTAPSFWEEEDEIQNRVDDDEAETPSLSSHPYTLRTSYLESSSSSSLDSHEAPAIPLEIKFHTDADTRKEQGELSQEIEVKSNRLSYRPLPVPSATPSRPLPRPPSILSIDTNSDLLSVTSTTVEDSPETPLSAREAKALKWALRASIDEHVDAMFSSYDFTEHSDGRIPSSLSITIPSDANNKLLHSPLPDSPTEPSFQPSPIVPDSSSTIETPTAALPEDPVSCPPDTSSTLETPTAALPETLISSPIEESLTESIPPLELPSKYSIAQDLETIYNVMLTEKGFFSEPHHHLPDLMKQVFGADHASSLASMRLMLPSDEMDNSLQTVKYMRGRSWTGDKKWRNAEWEKKEKGKKEGNSRPISPIIESRSSSDSTSSTPTPTPSKTIPEGISAKAAGRLGISPSELTAASRPSTSSSGSSGSSTLASSGRPSYESESADYSQDTVVEPEDVQMPSQSPGLVLWPSTFIPISPSELEMHVCKGMQELLGSKHTLAQYIQSKRDEDGNPFVNEDEFEDIMWQYECYRRERLNWPSDNPDLDMETDSPDHEDNIDLPYTYETSMSIAEAIKPRTSSIDSPDFAEKHVRTIRVYQAIKTRTQRMNFKGNSGI